MTVLGNQVFIDSGAVFNEKPLIILSYEEVVAKVEHISQKYETFKE